MTGSFWHVSGYKDSASRAQKQTKFAVLPRRRLSKRRLVLRKVVQAECKSKLVYGFAEARFRESGRQFVPGKDTNESIKALFLLREISDCSSACSTPCQTCGRLPPLAGGLHPVRVGDARAGCRRDFRAAAAHHAASNKNGVVGSSGTNIPTTPSTSIAHPNRM